MLPDQDCRSLIVHITYYFEQRPIERSHLSIEFSNNSKSPQTIRIVLTVL